MDADETADGPARRPRPPADRRCCATTAGCRARRWRASSGSRAGRCRTGSTGWSRRACCSASPCGSPARPTEAAVRAIMAIEVRSADTRAVVPALRRMPEVGAGAFDQRALGSRRRDRDRRPRRARRGADAIRALKPVANSETSILLAEVKSGAAGSGLNREGRRPDLTGTRGGGFPRPTVFETAAGFCAIAWSDAGITRFQLPTKSAKQPSGCCAPAARRRARHAAAGGGRGGGRGRGATSRASRSTSPAVAARLAGRSHSSRASTRRPAAVGWGETTTYGALAKALGAGPEAARDVGQAMAQNPVALIIPCHRVLAAGGKIGGFSAPGGAAAKRRMLELEGVGLDPAGGAAFVRLLGERIAPPPDAAQDQHRRRGLIARACARTGCALTRNVRRQAK